MPISIKQRRFINEYLTNGGNGTLAAEKAGYKGSADALAVQSSRLLRNAKVQEALAKPLEAEGNVQEQLVRELRFVAFAPVKGDVGIAAKLRAVELLAKITGLLDESTRQSVHVSVVGASKAMMEDIKAMNEEELLQTLAKLRSKGEQTTQ